MTYFFPIFLFITSGLVGCSIHDVSYYKKHPEAVGKALTVCPGKEPVGISCSDLTSIQEKVNQIIIDLRSNPQQFGQKIISLQKEIIVQRENISKGESSMELRRSLEENQEKLAEYLAVVRWLEMPEY